MLSDVVGWRQNLATLRQFPMEEIVGARNFNFAPKFHTTALNFALFSEDNIPVKDKIFRQVTFWGGQLPPVPFHVATGHLLST